jgi:hypothetical protein
MQLSADHQTADHPMAPEARHDLLPLIPNSFCHPTGRPMVVETTERPANWPAELINIQRASERHSHKRLILSYMNYSIKINHRLPSDHRRRSSGLLRRLKRIRRRPIELFAGIATTTITITMSRRDETDDDDDDDNYDYNYDKFTAAIITGLPRSDIFILFNRAIS